MKLATFYPGPSRVYANLTEFIYDAYMDGVMSINHRSDAFMELMAQTKAVLKATFLIPDDYEIVFTSSATECWEIIAQSLTVTGSQHFFNGAFGEKWHGYASRLVKAAAVPFDLETELPVDRPGTKSDVICITQNETSNGTQVTTEVMKNLRKATKESLLAVDATSSMAGILLDFKLADIWFCSVQKCFGLPAGMGVMVLSPKAVEKAYFVNERLHFNSLVNLLDNSKKNQTPYTPNVLSIYLLKRTQEISKGIQFVHDRAIRRYKLLKKMIESTSQLEFLVKNEKLRSKTVIAIHCDDPRAIQKNAEDYGIILGNGYGKLKDSTIRIANFPAIKSKEIEKLEKYFKNL